MPGYGGGGSALGGFASGLDESMRQGAGFLRQKKLQDQYQSNYDRYLKMLEAGRGGGTTMPMRPPDMGAGTAQQGGTPTQSPDGSWDTGDLPANPYEEPFSTMVSGQEPPEDIYMDPQGGAMGGYGGPGAQATGGAQALRPGRGAMEPEVAYAQRTGRMDAYNRMQGDKTKLLPQVRQMADELKLRDSTRNGWGVTPEERRMNREMFLKKLDPMQKDLDTLGGFPDQPEGLIEEQKGRVLRDTAIGYPGERPGQYSPMLGKAIDFLGNPPGSERHVAGAALLRKRFPDEELPPQPRGMPHAPRIPEQHYPKTYQPY